jgi:hypothetical protein
MADQKPLNEKKDSTGHSAKEEHEEKTDIKDLNSPRNKPKMMDPEAFSTAFVMQGRSNSPDSTKSIRRMCGSLSLKTNRSRM